jgi:hypothetical protein
MGVAAFEDLFNLVAIELGPDMQDDRRKGSKTQPINRAQFWVIGLRISQSYRP